MKSHIPTKIALASAFFLLAVFSGLYIYLPSFFTEFFIQYSNPSNLQSELPVFSHHLKMFFLTYFSLTMLFVVVMAYVLSREFIAKPVEEGIAMIRAMASGDLTFKMDLSNRFEIGELSRALNSLSDEIKRRLEDVVTSRSRLEAVFLSMSEGVIVIDDASEILLMNQTLKDLLHVTADPIGKKPLEVIRNIEVQEITDTVLKMDEGVISKEFHLLLPEEKILIMHATPVKRQWRNEGAVLVFHDITELRRLERIRQEFAANVSHELRTPVSTIKGYAETLLDGALDDKENAKDFLKIIHTDADRLAKLINDILDLSKIESGKTRMDLREVDISDILNDVVAGSVRLAKEKNIKIIKDIPLKLSKVVVDPGAMTQVFFNLLENAIKYNKENGQVLISVREHVDSFEINMKDTGIGIPQEDIARVFERFYRVDKARSREMGGTGLGLSIVKHIISAHQGEISVVSRLEQGSTFTIILPKKY